VDDWDRPVYNLAMPRKRSRDLIEQFVIGSEGHTKEVVRAHVFGGEPVAAPPPVAWQDTHRTFEVEVRLSGDADITLGETTFALVPGDVVLIPAWEPHIISSAAPGGESLVIQFLPEFLGHRTIGGILWLSLFAVPADKRPRTDPAYCHQVLATAKNIRYEVEAMPFGWEDGIRAELIKLLLLLIRSSSFDHDTALDSRHRYLALERIMPAVTLAYSDPSKRYSLEQAADACLLSARRFGSLFRSVMGVTFTQFSLHVRLRRAAELLSLTDLPVETIAGTTGFADHSHLSRAFARAFGSRPTDYRRSL